MNAMRRALFEALALVAALLLAVVSAVLDFAAFYYGSGLRVGNITFSYAIFSEVVAVVLATWAVRSWFGGRWYILVPLAFAAVVVAETLIQVRVWL